MKTQNAMISLTYAFRDPHAMHFHLRHPVYSSVSWKSNNILLKLKLRLFQFPDLCILKHPVDNVRKCLLVSD